MQKRVQRGCESRVLFNGDARIENKQVKQSKTKRKDW